jgi:hypothetical protein
MVAARPERQAGANGPRYSFYQSNCHLTVMDLADSRLHPVIELALETGDRTRPIEPVSEGELS